MSIASQESPNPLPTARWHDLIVGAARRIVRQFAPCSMEPDDFSQEVMMRLWRQYDRLREQPGSREGIIRRAIGQTAANLQRHIRAIKRDPQRARSLDQGGLDQANEHPETDKIAETIRTAHRRYFPRDEQEQRELALDLARFLEGLPDSLRTLALHLMHLPLARCAREVGVPRTTLYRDLKDLRTRLQAAGMHHYLE